MVQLPDLRLLPAKSANDGPMMQIMSACWFVKGTGFTEIIASSEFIYKRLPMDDPSRCLLLWMSLEGNEPCNNLGTFRPTFWSDLFERAPTELYKVFARKFKQ